MSNATALIAVLLLACAPAWAGGSVSLAAASDEYFEGQNDLDINTQDALIVGWFKTSTDPSGSISSLLTYSANGSVNDNRDRIGVWLDDANACGGADDGNVEIRFFLDSGGSAGNACGDTDGWTDGAWHHVAIYWDRSVGSDIYVDGVQESETEVSDGTGVGTDVDDTAGATGRSIQIGTLRGSGGIANTLDFDGELAYWAVYVNPTAAEADIIRAQSLYCVPPAHPTLRALFHLTSADAAEDYSNWTNASTLTAVNTPTDSADGPPVSQCGYGGN